MTRLIIAISASALLFACSEEKPEPAASEAVPSEGETEAKEPVSKAKTLEKLEAALAPVVKAKEDIATRRAECLTLHKTVKAEPALEGEVTNQKLLDFLSQARRFCAEIFETEKALQKAKEPETQVALSGQLASMFTSGDLKKAFKKVKRTVKRKKDPEAECKKVMVMVDALKDKKRRKTKKLVKRARSYCEGRALTASVGFQLKEAQKALSEERASSFAQACALAVTKLEAVKSEKAKARLQETAKPLCIEAFALNAPGGAS